ncbi:MAG: hypothetical protein RUMPE_01015 [Eubacteriales bacterium SKADARSKE-1]|nr:hypothetical protein [Eubacteriales bacterium SKADARSKE-1]
MDNSSQFKDNNVPSSDFVKTKKISKKFLVIIISVFLVIGSLICLRMFIDKTNSQQITIPIAMAADDNYTYPTIVAMTSILENAKPTTKYEFYVMVPGNFNEENKNKILSAKDKYKNATIDLINMEDKFKSANTHGHITTPGYYRLSLSSLFPNFDKIIWLDGDTITLGDLTGMFNIDMEDDYYKGFLDDNINGAESLGVDDDHYICSGVMLVNLKKLRQDNIEQKFAEFIEENNEKLIQHDQTVINVLCYKNIGVLPPQYGIFNYYLENIDSAVSYNNNLKPNSRYSLNDITKAYENPVIVHCVNKPWKDKTVPYFDKWWDYAKKTAFYDEMKSKYTEVFN